MNTAVDPVPGARRGAGKWLGLALVGLLVATVATWWAIGLRDAMAIGFSETPVSFTFVDTTLEDAVALLRPGVPLHREGPTSFEINLKVTAMQERDAFRWIAQLSDQQIELRDGIITVREVPWLERSYQWTARWASETLSIRLWPNR